MSHTYRDVKYDLTVSDVAEKFGKSPTHVRWLAQRRRIPSLTVGRQYWFNEQQVADILFKINEVKEVENDLPGSAFDEELVSGI